METTMVNDSCLEIMSAEEMEIYKREFRAFSDACDSYKIPDDEYEDFVPDETCGLTSVEKGKRVFRYSLNPDKEDKDKMTCLGIVPQSLLTKKKVVPLCLSLYDGTKKACKKGRCKFVHAFENITFCRGNCGIRFENNLYSGKCLKRHFFEDFDNYLFRNRLKLKTKTGLSLKLSRKPTLDEVSFILTTAKDLKYKEISIELV